MYHDFMKEYFNLGMSLLDKFPDTPHYFIPHQCVLRPQITTTKIRVVFDASYRTSSHVSLNEMLMVGPTIQQELCSILIRVRFHDYVITADVGRMYRPTAVEMNWSFYRLVEAIQKSTFSEEISELRKSLILPSNILTPFIQTFTDEERAF